MYKIYINNTPIHLISAADKDQFPPNSDDYLLARYPGKAKLLLSYIDMLEKSSRFKAVTLYASDVEQLFADFSGHFKIIEAAGGVVFNPSDEILFIFRRGFWDLPKGKIDEGETPAEAAIREVQEETGLQQVAMGDELPVTYHTYRHPKTNKRVLKRTYWYKMTTAENELVPQTEEDIEQALWLSLAAFAEKEEPVYSNIVELLDNIS